MCKKLLQCPKGTIACREKNASYLFITQIQQDGTNGEGDSIYFRFQPRVRFQFDDLTLKVKTLTVNGLDIDLSLIELYVKI